MRNIPRNPRLKRTPKFHGETVARAEFEGKLSPLARRLRDTIEDELARIKKSHLVWELEVRPPGTMEVEGVMRRYEPQITVHFRNANGFGLHPSDFRWFGTTNANLRDLVRYYFEQIFDDGQD